MGFKLAERVKFKKKKLFINSCGDVCRKHCDKPWKPVAPSKKENNFERKHLSLFKTHLHIEENKKGFCRQDIMPVNAGFDESEIYVPVFFPIFHVILSPLVGNKREKFRDGVSVFGLGNFHLNILIDRASK